LNDFNDMLCCCTPKEKKEETSPQEEKSKASFEPWEKAEFLMGEVIGQGALGEVRTARRKKDGKIVAVKRMSLSDLDEDDLEQVECEINLLQQCRHPNIVELYNIYKSEDDIFIIMEYLSGQPLYSRIISRAKKQLDLSIDSDDKYSVQLLTEESISFYISQILQGLYFLHSQRIVHGDIKPENIIFTSQKSKALKIIDFGYARKRTQFKYCNMPRGTPMYMAPDYLTGQYTENVDIWAVGIMTFELLYGYAPFQGNFMKRSSTIFTPKRIIQFASKGLHSEEKPGKGPWFNSDIDVSPEAKEFIRSLLHTDPVMRVTAEEALNLPWISEESHVVIDFKSVQHMLAFTNLNEIQQVFKPFLMTKDILNANILKNLKEAFNQVDTDGSGEIDYAEFCQCLKNAIEFELPEDISHDCFNAIDEDAGGTISYDEFVRWYAWTYIVSQDERIWRVVERKFDADGDGRITLDEIRQTCHSNPERAASISEEAMHALETLFQDRDAIAISEICKFCANSNAMDGRVNITESLRSIRMDKSEIQRILEDEDRIVIPTPSPDI